MLKTGKIRELMVIFVFQIVTTIDVFAFIDFKAWNAADGADDD